MTDGMDVRKMAAQRLLRDAPDSCPRCWGSGKVADDDEESPWPLWDALEGPSRLAVTLGIVAPHPCPACGGSALVGEVPDADRV